LAALLAKHANFQVIRSDAVRKELARSVAPGEDIYTTRWNERTYRECLRLAEDWLFAGERVLVDANFRRETERRMYLAMAARWHVPALFLHCRTDAGTARRRLGERKGDVSDADWKVYQQLASTWETPGYETQASLRVIDATEGPDDCLRQALSALGNEGLHDDKQGGDRTA
jgi:predicted kinase